MNASALLTVGNNPQQQGQALFVDRLLGLNGLVQLYKASCGRLAKQLLENDAVSLIDGLHNARSAILLSAIRSCASDTLVWSTLAGLVFGWLGCLDDQS